MKKSLMITEKTTIFGSSKEKILHLISYKYGILTMQKKLSFHSIRDNRDNYTL